MKNLILITVGLMLSSCSELLLLSSVGGVAVSQSPAVKAYNSIDAITIMQTDKDIKQHAYERIKNETKKTKSDE
jgi:5'-3' exonuclease|tara:strand:+ start:159 stop:380 length:222 start_codon:yes stop_codon:yes gene_type:complete